MDKPIVIHTHNRILLSNGEEGTNGTCHNIDESQNNFSEWRKSDILLKKMEYICMYDSVYIKF